MIYLKWTAVLVIMTLLELSCTADRIAGNGSQVGNPMITGMILAADGTTPACSAYIYLRTRNTAITPVVMINQHSDTIAVIRAGCDGKFSISSIDPGLYVIDGSDGGNDLAFVDSINVQNSDSTINLAPAVLKPAGAVRGRILLPEGGDPRKVLVIIAALDRFTTADSNGNFKFERLAESHYSLKIFPTLDNYGIIDTVNIPVKSADTTDLGSITPPFTGIPAIKKLTVFYDTLHQKAKLSWNRPDTALVKSFNVYRRETDPATAFITQLNFFPVTDTFYIDSFCEQNKMYEYYVTAVDTHTNEGIRSSGVTIRIALYDITPNNIVMNYDTLRQTMTLQWSNPDTGLVKSYNVYRRNVRLNEKFWTPFNNSPVRDTFFIDSTFRLCPTGDGSCDDSPDQNSPDYEYCVAALINNIREGVRSAGIPLLISMKYLTPQSLTFSYDTLQQRVYLQWRRPDMTIVRGFNIFRRCISTNETVFYQINNVDIQDALYTDSTGGQNKFYEYRVASVVKNGRAEVKSAGVKVHVAASFVEDTVFVNDINVPEQLSFPNDIAVDTNDNMYIVDQGNGRILVFDSAMHYVNQIGKGILDYPLKVSVDDQGRVFTADYNRERDFSSVFIFDNTGAVIDTILDSIVVNDLDARHGLLYTVSEGKSVSIYNYEEIKQRSWQVNGQDGSKWIIAGEMNRIFVSTGLLFADKNKVIVFDSLGKSISSIMLPFYPHAMAFDKTRQLLYVICYNGTNGSMLHVIDRNNVEKGRYKIQSDNKNSSIGIQKNGAVFIVLKNEGKILKLKPSGIF